MTKHYSRKEFYELVWTRPITHWAKEFRLSDVAIHKICKKHNIPTPPPGWWAKQAAGHKVSKTPLPPSESEGEVQISIVAADAWKEGDSLAAAREVARVSASSPAEPLPAKAKQIVERTIRQLRNSSLNERGLAGASGGNVISCLVSPQSIERLVTALPEILAAAAVQGFQVREGEKSAEFRNEAEALSFSILEMTKQVPHVMTQAELRRQAEFDEEKKKLHRRNPSDAMFLWGPTFPKWDMQPTGQLTFELEHVYVVNGASPRRSFKDGKSQRLETMAGDIAVGLAVLAAAKTETRLHFEEQERKREAERLRREAVARRKFIEDKRLKGLSAILSELDELDRLRTLMAKLHTVHLVSSSSRLETFLAWAATHLQKREQVLSADSLETRFTEDRLFGDDDDAGFKPQIGYF